MSTSRPMVERVKQRFALPEQPVDLDDYLSAATKVRWDPTTKLLVGLAALVVVFAIASQLTNLIVPLLLAAILVIVTRPAATWLHTRTNWRWSLSVAVVYGTGALVSFVLLLAIGSRVVQELYAIATSFRTTADQAIADAGTLSDATASLVSDGVSVALSLLARITAATISALGWLFFIVSAAFFVLLESEPSASRRLGPGPMADDIALLSAQFRTTWGSWIYGQVILSILTFLSYFVLLSVFQVQNALALSLVSVIGRFVPYLGATITWTLVFVSAFTQPTNPFGWPPLSYAALVVVLAILMDQTFDQLIMPQLFGKVLRLPTALVLVGTLALGTLLGFFGMFVAAPLLASGKVLLQWLSARVFDEDVPTVAHPPDDAPAVLAE